MTATKTSNTPFVDARSILASFRVFGVIHVIALLCVMMAWLGAEGMHILIFGGMASVFLLSLALFFSWHGRSSIDQAALSKRLVLAIKTCKVSTLGRFNELTKASKDLPQAYGLVLEVSDRYQDDVAMEIRHYLELLGYVQAGKTEDDRLARITRFFFRKGRVLYDIKCTRVSCGEGGTSLHLVQLRRELD